MYSLIMIKKRLDDFYYLLEKAFSEDLLDVGDVTSMAIFDKEDKTSFILLAKQDCLLFGLEYFKLCFLYIDKELEFIQYKNDGDKIFSGDILIEINGSTESILKSERVALNFLSFLSGISTKANYFASLLEDSSTVILDTRKTLPAYRSLSKEAVLIGGAKNHRMGLFDMIMIKDNHIDSAGSISLAVKKVKEKYDNKYKIEVECRNENEVLEAINSKIDVVMLDNITAEECKRIIKKYKGQVKFECSGAMNEEKIKLYKDIGADYISVGMLSHSVKGIDFSLKTKPS